MKPEFAVGLIFTLVGFGWAFLVPYYSVITYCQSPNNDCEVMLFFLSPIFFGPFVLGLVGLYLIYHSRTQNASRVRQ